MKAIQDILNEAVYGKEHGMPFRRAKPSGRRSDIEDADEILARESKIGSRRPFEESKRVWPEVSVYAESFRLVNYGEESIIPELFPPSRCELVCRIHRHAERPADACLAADCGWRTRPHHRSDGKREDDGCLPMGDKSTDRRKMAARPHQGALHFTTQGAQ